MTGDHPDVASLIRDSWPTAMAKWSSFLILNPPDLRNEQESLAQINLHTRAISLNEMLIRDWELYDCIPAMLAHEIGHHVSYPGTLQVQARMRLLERTIVPFPEYSLINHFTDLMINERLGRGDLRDQMIRIYQASISRMATVQGDGWKRDPLFLFYLALYEALWDLEEGEILGTFATKFAQAYPQYKSDAALLVQDVFVLGPNIYTQFLYFLSLSVRYLLPLIADHETGHDEASDENNGVPILANGKGCDCGEPSATDWGQAMTPTFAEKEAIRRAIEEGWFDIKQLDRLSRALDIEQRISGLPGMGSEDAQQVPEIMAAYYRQQAEKLLFRPPVQPRIGEAIVPSILEDWIPGDTVRDIDWLGTLLHRGDKLGTCMPLKRIYESEIEGEDVRFYQARMEIYLDVSGSMPNPCITLNPMTLAAQILTSATIRSGGQVRIALYSHTSIEFWEWSRSERDLSGFLMHYIGGGTEFPFELLEKSFRDCGRDQPIRIVITDDDFDANVSSTPRATSILCDVASHSPGFILLKLGSTMLEDSAEVTVPSTSTYRTFGLTVVPVTEFDNYPKIARDLAWALFPETEHASN